MSEPLKPVPSVAVIDWLRRLDEDRAFVSVVTLAEIRRGIAALVDGKRKTRLARWLDADLRQRFSERIVVIDDVIAIAWGDLTSECRRRGRSLHVMDGFIAATASVYRLTIVTRDVGDFENLGVDVLNPWQG